jgi:hypothetical protein
MTATAMPLIRCRPNYRRRRSDDVLRTDGLIYRYGNSQTLDRLFYTSASSSCSWRRTGSVREARKSETVG